MSVEIRGFRAFGTEARRLHLDAPIAVVHAGNSQGKTSLAEALEFLISGRSSRRELLGGAKAEYHGSLRNAHLPTGDDTVYVEAVLRAPDGTAHRVRRELLCDFGPGAECESQLLIDGTAAADLARIGLPMADPPIRAPVLLQHTLRHVLSTEPKQRVDYFKALLSLTDLDRLRARVAAARGRVEAEPPGPALRLVAALNNTPAAEAAATLAALPDSVDGGTITTAATKVDQTLLAAGEALLGVRAGSLEELTTTVRSTLAAQQERAFPLAAFTATAAPAAPPSPDLGPYSKALTAADRRDARLAPLFTAVLADDDYATLDHPVDCPVCATSAALTPERLAALRDQLRRTEALDTTARAAARVVSEARRDLEQLYEAASRAVPSAAEWTTQQLAEALDKLRELAVDTELAATAHNSAQHVATVHEAVEAAARRGTQVLDRTAEAIAGRADLPVEVAGVYAELRAALAAFGAAVEDHRARATALRSAVEPAIRGHASRNGLAELSDLLARREELTADVVAEGARRRVVARVTTADKALRTAAGRVLDARFARMSDTIGAWWTSIRPEELVGFGGVKRRAGGALFVNLVAALRADPTWDAVERDALGVYSDSQLNALGLSIFLARAELLGVPLVVLDDPIPGSDADHRLTFVQNSLGRLLDAGTQVVLTTFDGKLADWAQSNHDWRGLVAYELNLLDVVAGTDVTQTSDTFSRLLLEASDNINSPTARGRRAACGSLRAAAERLAKQIVATGRTQDGHPSSVADVHGEASVLGDLVPLVNGYALDNAEKGQWRTFAKVLNPGNHDDDVPSTTELKQVRSNLRKIAKAHNAHWPMGLLL